MKKFLLIGGALLLIAGISVSATTAYYFYSENQKSQYLLQNPTEAAKEESKNLVHKVGKFIELPQEEVTIATIIDENMLKDQAFFTKAKKGDKVLIYTAARKAILYRPVTNKVIEVAPINIGEGTETASSPSAQVAGETTALPTPEASVEASPHPQVSP